MRNRVLFVDHVAQLGGAELSLLDIATHFGKQAKVVLFENGPFQHRLRDRGLDVGVIGTSESITGISRGSRTWRGMIALPALGLLASKLAMEAEQADVIYANSQKAMVVSALAGLRARKPVIWHLRDILSDRHFSKGHLRIVRVLANRLVTSVIANSKATRDAFVACGGRRSLVQVVYNGVDSTPFDAISDTETKQLRAKMGFANRKVVGVFGRLARWKGQHVLIDAMLEMPDVHAIIVGAALFQDDHKYEVELREQALRLGLGSRITFLGFRSDVPKLMKMVDAVLHTSTAPEPFGRVIVEGMLAVKPVIATRAGGALEIVDTERTGLLVAAGDANALAEAVSRVLNSNELSNRLATQGRAEACDRFSEEEMTFRVSKLVDLVASAKSNSLS